MDRILTYPGAIPLDTDPLGISRNAMVGLGYALQAAIGNGTYLDGLDCNPGSGLTVVIAQGSMTGISTVDFAAYGSLGTSADPVIKQGVNTTATVLSCPAPGTAGQSRNYLIQASLSETDTGATVLPYYNPSNPAQRYQGPANSGVAQATVRQCRVLLQAKAGTAATTGSQTTPTADAGFAGLYVVTVANGATSIVTGNIVPVGSAPFLRWKPGTNGPPFCSRIGAAILANYTIKPSDQGCSFYIANACTVTIPDPTTVTFGFSLHFVSGFAATLTLAAGQMLAAGPLTGASSITLNPQSYVALIADGTNWRILGGSADLTAPPHGEAYSTSSGTFTVPAGVTQVHYTIWGAGAGGGGSSSTWAGGGGGAGERRRGWASVTPGQSISITIGAGGAGGGAGLNGADGTDTTFDAFATAKGGIKGLAGTSNFGSGGNGGSGGSGGIGHGGDPGGTGYPAGGSTIVTGTGGASPGFSNHPQAYATSQAGGSSIYPGNGGNGGMNGGTGGAGASGACLIEW